MRDLLAGFAVVGTIIAVYALVGLIAEYLPWLGVILLGWVMATIVVHMLQALGVVRIDLRKLRS